MPQNAATKNRCIYFKLFFEYWHISTMKSELYCRPRWCPVPCLTLTLALLNVFHLWFFFPFFLQRHQNHRDVSNGSKSALFSANSCRGGTAVALPRYSSFALMVIHLCINMFCMTARLEPAKLPRKAWQSPVTCVVWPGVAQAPECVDC